MWFLSCCLYNAVSDFWWRMAPQENDLLLCICDSVIPFLFVASQHIIIISPSSALKRPASSKPAIRGKHSRLSAGPPAPDAAKAAASRSSSTIRAKTSLAPQSGSSERRKTGEGEGSGDSAVGGVSEVSVADITSEDLL